MISVSQKCSLVHACETPVSCSVTAVAWEEEEMRQHTQVQALCFSRG